MNKQHPEQAFSNLGTLIAWVQSTARSPLLGDPRYDGAGRVFAVSTTQRLHAERVIALSSARATWDTEDPPHHFTRWGEDRTPTRSDCLHGEDIE